MVHARMAVFVILMTPTLFGWGHDGHRVVAKIAAKNLTAATRAKLVAILGTTDAGLEEAMAAASTWPDEINKTATGTREWHFIDVPVNSPFSVAGLCPGNNCVLDRINEMIQRLQGNQTGFTLAAPPTPPRPMVSQEVAFLVHFIGDIHQPLHSANNGDRGGNCINLKKPIPHAGGTPTKEVHALWDVDEVLAVFQDLAGSKTAGMSDEDNTASVLSARHQAAGTGTWESAPVEDWAKEANALAKSDVYQKLKQPNRTAPAGQCAVGIKAVSISSGYLKGNAADTEQQLMRAGIRLANTLNQICAGAGCDANAGGVSGAE